MSDGAPADAIRVTYSFEKQGQIVRTQWLDHPAEVKTPLLYKRMLIVDEVDDTRTTLKYCIDELYKDINVQLATLPESERADAAAKTEIAVFVVHNKRKPKAAEIPGNIKYYTSAEYDDVWVSYPWEQKDILLHNKLAAEQKAKK